MDDIEYIKVTNRSKLSSAGAILSDVLCGEQYGITLEERQKITVPLWEAIDRLQEKLGKGE